MSRVGVKIGFVFRARVNPRFCRVRLVGTKAYSWWWCFLKVRWGEVR